MVDQPVHGRADPPVPFSIVYDATALILTMAAEGQSTGPCQTGADVCKQGDGPAKTSRRQTEFREERQRQFGAFQAAFGEVAREAKFGVIIGPSGEVDWSLFEPHEPALIEGHEPALQTFFSAYRALRIQHQLDFANYKLTSDGKLFSDRPHRQAELLASVSKFGIQFVIVVHICVFLIIVCSLLFGFRFAATTAVTGIFAFAIIALAIVSLCAHAFAQGLQPDREVERYQQYGSAVRAILADFDASKDPMEKLKIMTRMERVAFTEMRNFRITHHEHSSFAM